MAKFTTRVELLGTPPESEYKKLHAEMAKKGFSRTIDGDGVTFELPHAEYNYASDTETTSQVRDKAVAVARTVQDEFRVLVTKAGEVRSWHNLKKVDS